MTFEELKKSTLSDIVDWMLALNACPCTSGDEEICISDDTGSLDCQRCWEMHLNGESREPEGEDPKETGRGYRV